MNKPLVSVVMPAFNGEQTIKAAIDSILEQTFQDFELIVINDGSTDNTDGIVKSYNDPRIVYLSQDNKGVSESLNEGISLSQTNFIARLDCDDIALPTRLEKQYSYLMNHPQTVLLGSAVEYIDDTGHVFGRNFPFIFSKTIKEMLKQENIFVHPSVMLRKDAAANFNFYNKKLSGLFEDYHLWFNLMDVGICDNLSEVLTQYRISSRQITSWVTSEEYNSLMHNIIFNNEINNENITQIRKYREQCKNTNSTYAVNRKRAIEGTIYNRCYKFLCKCKISNKQSGLIITIIKNIICYFGCFKK